MIEVVHVLARVSGTVVCFAAALLLWAWAVRRDERRRRVPPRPGDPLSRPREDGRIFKE
jgi:hypothetical protein